MSYHAYRNIGFIFTDTEANCVKWRRKFTDFDPAVAMEVLGLHRTGSHLFIDYLGVPYRLNVTNGVLEKEVEGAWSEELFMNEALVVYHMLGDVQADADLSGEWVPENGLDPVQVRSGNRTDPLLKGFASDFAGKTDLLKRACEKAGGAWLLPPSMPSGQQSLKQLFRGDLVFQFYPFPQTPVILDFYDADEDFPAQAQVYVDGHITRYMHFEAVGCMIADLFEKIGALAREMI